MNTALTIAAFAAGALLSAGIAVPLARRPLRAALAEALDSRDQARSALAEAGAEHRDLTAENRRLVVERDGLRKGESRLMANLHRLLAPAVSECTKIRLCSQEEAAEFGRRVEFETGCGELQGYACKICPRNPATGSRFWHVTHVDPAQRGKVHRPNGGMDVLQNRVAPQDIAALRERVAGGGE